MFFIFLSFMLSAFFYKKSQKKNFKKISKISFFKKSQNSSFLYIIFLLIFLFTLITIIDNDIIYNTIILLSYFLMSKKCKEMSNEKMKKVAKPFIII